jgi:hypothetical protein
MYKDNKEVYTLIGEFVMEASKAEHALDNFLVCAGNKYPDELEGTKYSKSFPMHAKNKLTLAEVFFKEVTELHNFGHDFIEDYFIFLNSLNNFRNRIVHGSAYLIYISTVDESYICTSKYTKNKSSKNELFLCSEQINLSRITEALEEFRKMKLFFWETKQLLASEE